MKGLRGRSGGIRLLPGSLRSERAGLLKTGVISLAFHCIFLAFLSLSLGSGGGSSIYRFTIRPFSRPGNGLPEGGPPAGSPAAERPALAKAHSQTAADRSRHKMKQGRIALEEQKQPLQRQERAETARAITIAEKAALPVEARPTREGDPIPVRPGEQAKGNDSGGSGQGEGVQGTGQGSGEGGFGIGLGQGQGGFGWGRSLSSPRYAQNPKPVYPPEARAKGYQGKVLLRVEVLPNGQVGQIAVKKTSGYEALDQSALAAVKQWRFIPARKGEVAVPVWVIIPIKFQLL
jgi:TonB family protein